MRISCPHCGERCATRTSRRPSPALYEAYVHCTNADCGFASKVYVEFALTTTPSLAPRAGVQIPMDSECRRDLIKQLQAPRKRAELTTN